MKGGKRNRISNLTHQPAFIKFDKSDGVKFFLDVRYARLQNHHH